MDRYYTKTGTYRYYSKKFCDTRHVRNSSTAYFGKHGLPIERFDCAFWRVYFENECSVRRIQLNVTLTANS